jgi:hypothetical protein
MADIQVTWRAAASYVRKPAMLQVGRAIYDFEIALQLARRAEPRM